MSARNRLDEELVRRGLCRSRAQARDCIRRGEVTVSGEPAIKPAQLVDEATALTLSAGAARYVSRAALKLAHALEVFQIDVTGAEALDIGASTGGFTQVLLEAGAARVTAIDVGHGQMDATLAADPRVRLIEGLNARELTTEHLPAAPDIIVCDVSFISLKLALPPALALARPRARLVALIKPQFEAGKAALGKGGILRDEAARMAVLDDISSWLAAQESWRVIATAPSPVEGGDGNVEFLISAEKT